MATVMTEKQQCRRYAQAFGRSVYADILRWGESELLTLLCRAYARNDEDTYMDCIRRFYSSLKKNYRCEYIFKNEIIAELRKHYARRRTLVVNEFRVGNSIVDLAFFNGESRAYEIKTSYDSPRRLKGQMDDYKRVFDRCYIVVEQSEVEDWLVYDDSIGIIAFCYGPRGKISLKEIRPSMRNEQIEVDVLMTCLRANEYEYIAEHFAKARLADAKYKHYDECKKILSGMDGELLHDAFLTTIKQRKSSFNLLEQTPHELYQICLSLHLTSKQLELLKCSLNNKII